MILIETVILWADVEKNDLALSFEDAEGRDDIWYGTRAR
jgi:hypothetical protein